MPDAVAASSRVNPTPGRPPRQHLPSATIPGISDVVRAEGPLLFVSGQSAVNSDGQVPSTFEAQLHGAFEAVQAAVRRAGSDMGALVRLTIYVTDLPARSLHDIRSIRDQWVDTSAPPASALIGVAALFDPAVHVEIEAIATT